jgi:hypothetical protein
MVKIFSVNKLVVKFSYLYDLTCFDPSGAIFRDSTVKYIYFSVAVHLSEIIIYRVINYEVGSNCLCLNII